MAGKATTHYTIIMVSPLVLTILLPTSPTPARPIRRNQSLIIFWTPVDGDNNQQMSKCSQLTKLMSPLDFRLRHYLLDYEVQMQFMEGGEIVCFSVYSSFDEHDTKNTCEAVQ